MADEPRSFDPNAPRERPQRRPDEQVQPKPAVSRLDGTRLEPRNGTGMGDTGGDLGAGTPANVDIHDIDQDDNPQAEWGQDTGGAAVHSTSRGDRAQGKSQGPKTQARTREINSGGQ